MKQSMSRTGGLTLRDIGTWAILKSLEGRVGKFRMGSTDRHNRHWVFFNGDCFYLAGKEGRWLIDALRHEPRDYRIIKYES
jgi:hypothetical protein